MPLDGASPPDYLAKFDRAIELIATPAQWVKNTERNRHGQYCLRGALVAAGLAEMFEPLVLEAVNETTGHNYPSIVSFNDAPQTEHADVLRALRQARAYIAAGQAAGGTPAGAPRQDRGVAEETR